MLLQFKSERKSEFDIICFNYLVLKGLGFRVVKKCGRGGYALIQRGPSRFGQWSYLECGHGWVPAIPVYGVELGRVVELMVQLRMSFASVHHFLEGKRGRDSKNEPKTGTKKAKRRGGAI